jgi:hypothetical protein
MNRGKTRDKLKLEHFLAAGLVIAILAIAGVSSLIAHEALPPKDTDPDPGGTISIGGISHSPLDPESSESVTVTCRVYSDFPVTAVYLYYDTGGIENRPITMSGTTSRTATIPAQSDGTTVTYWIVVSTSGGGTETSAHRFYTVHDPPPPVTTPTTTTETETPPEPEQIIWQLTVLDHLGNDITDTIYTATIQGTIHFEVVLLSGASRVYSTKLEVTGISAEASPGGYWYFSQEAEDTWILDFDTTVINNGEYLFQFVLLIYADDYVPVAGGDPDIWDMPFSSFYFGQSDEGGSFLTADLLGIAVVAIVIVIIVGGITITVYRKQTKKRRGRK